MFDEEFDLPDDLMAMADSAAAALASMGEEYAADASRDADKLLGFAKAVQAAKIDALRRQAFIEIFSIAHNFKGQGATFGYDLVTTIGDQLCELTREKSNPGQGQIPQTVRLCAALHTILHQRLAGDGGPTGSRLCEELGIAA